MIGEILTVKDVAQKFNMQVSTIHYLVQSGQIPFSRLGQRCIRFSTEKLDRWFEKRHGVEYRLKTKD